MVNQRHKLHMGNTGSQKRITEKTQKRLTVKYFTELSVLSG